MHIHSVIEGLGFTVMNHTKFQNTEQNFKLVLTSQGLKGSQFNVRSGRGTMDRTCAEHATGRVIVQ